MVVVVDDEDRENEGDLTIAAQFATPEAINFMATHARGLICLCLTEERCRRARPAPDDRPQRGAARHRVHRLGRGARGRDDRHLGGRPRRTIQVAIDPESTPHDLVQPGHVFPLRAQAGGVLERTGQTEAAVDLARLAGLNPSGVVCEIMNDDGTMARVSDLVPVLRAARAEDGHRRRPRRVPAPAREARRARRRGAPADRLRRVHRGRVPREADRQDARRARQGRGRRRGGRARARPLRVPDRRRLPLAALRLRRAARPGAARRSRPRAAACCSTWRRRAAASACSTSCAPTSCRSRGCDTVEANLELGFPADARDYGIGNQILADLGLTTIRILTNNPKKLTGIDGFGLTVVEQVPIEVAPQAENQRYLATKRDKLGHRLHHQDLKNLDLDRDHDEKTENA